jgi:hypothetical protein
MFSLLSASCIFCSLKGPWTVHHSGLISEGIKAIAAIKELQSSRNMKPTLEGPAHQQGASWEGNKKRVNFIDQVRESVSLFLLVADSGRVCTHKVGL